MHLIELDNQIQNWATYKEKVSSLTKKAKGDTFEQLVKFYFQIDPQYKSKIKHIWLLQEVPHKIKEYLSLPEPDKGIDLIAETNDKEYWAVQCKFRDDESKTITWREISTFTGLTFGICKNISFGIICSTTERLTKVLKHQDKIAFCSSEIWRNLDERFFNDLRNLLEGKKVLPEKFSPRPHQVRAINNALKHFVEEGNSRGKMIMPCGSGKSLTAFWIADKIKANKILIAVPSLALIRQSLKIWLKEVVARNIEADWICIASDETVSEIKDDPVILKQDLGIPALTDAAAISTWFNKKSTGLKIVFTTYQSSKVLAKAATDIEFSFDLGIMDEAHKTVGSKNKLFSHLLFDKNISIEKRLFMTATERRYAGDKDEIISMEDVNIYGDTFELLTFKEAINAVPKILSDYKIITLLVTNDEIKKYITNNLLLKLDKTKIDDEITSQQFASLIALRKAIQKYPIKHAISFHNSIKKARLFQHYHDLFNEEHKEFTKLNSFHVSGIMPTSVRDNIIRDFDKNEPSLITNARCLTEGVDVPGIDCVLFSEPRKSTIDIVQAVGRALRIKEGKEFGYVLLPIVVEENKLSDGFERSKAFKSILSVLRSLASNDERIIEYFRAKQSGNTTDRNIFVEVDEKISKTINYDDFLNRLELKVWDKLAILSWKPFEEAKAFVQSLGLKSQTQWFLYCKDRLKGFSPKPLDIPNHPHGVYKYAGWSNWGDWLGTGSTATFLKEYREYDAAKTFVTKLNLKNGSEWKKYCENQIPGLPILPKDIPKAPNAVYSKLGWSGWGDWLGTGFIPFYKRKYQEFYKARTFSRLLNLKSSTEWGKYSKGELNVLPQRPEDIPANPSTVYKNHGWIDWGDWLGTGAIATFKRKFLPFEEARNFVHSLGINSLSEWRKYCKGQLPDKGSIRDDIPSNPHRNYKNKGWINYEDWLGAKHYRRIKINYFPFQQARNIVRKLNLKNQNDWRNYCQTAKPQEIPGHPHVIYKNDGWIDYGDWLGTNRIATRQMKFLPFDEARKFVRSLNLPSQTEWQAYCKTSRPTNIPANPNTVYKGKGWKGFGDWLGTKNLSPKDYKNRYRKFADARAFVHKLGLKTRKEWKKYCDGEMEGKKKMPYDIPSTPWGTYKVKGWMGMPDWLGTDFIATYKRKYLSFEEARKFAHSLHLTSVSDWSKYCKGKLPDKPNKPRNIPASPEKVYRNLGWISWVDWLGRNYIATRKRRYLTFPEARAFVRTLKLKNGIEYRKYLKQNNIFNLPTTPSEKYKKQGWTSMDDWLGNEYLLYEEAKQYVQKLNLKSQKAWRLFVRVKSKTPNGLPKNIPRTPQRVYKNSGWKSWGEWLGHGRIADRKKVYLSFVDAREYVRKLKLAKTEEWNLYCKGSLKSKGVKPENIPSSPWNTYKNQGWKGMRDWLGA